VRIDRRTLLGSLAIGGVFGFRDWIGHGVAAKAGASLRTSAIDERLARVLTRPDQMPATVASLTPDEASELLSFRVRFDDGNEWTSGETPWSWGRDDGVPRGAIVALRNGSRLVARGVRLDERTLSIDSLRFGPLAIPRDRLAWILLRPRHDAIRRFGQMADLGARGDSERLLLEGGDQVVGERVVSSVDASSVIAWSIETLGARLPLGSERVVGMSATRDSDQAPVSQAPWRLAWSDGTSVDVTRLIRDASRIVGLESAEGLELPLGNRGSLLDGLTAVRRFRDGAVRFPVTAPRSSATVPAIGEPIARSADELRQGGVGSRDRLVAGGRRIDSLAMRTTGTEAYELPAANGWLSGRVAVADGSGRDRAIVRLFRRRSDGGWDAMPAWEGNVRRGEPAVEFDVRIEQGGGLAINGAIDGTEPPGAEVVWDAMAWRSDG